MSNLVLFDRKKYSKQYYEQHKSRILQYQREYYLKRKKPKQKPHFEVRTGRFLLFDESIPQKLWGKDMNGIGKHGTE